MKRVIGAGSVSLDTEHVVQMTPIEGSRLERLDIDVTAGYNFTKASEVQQFTMGVEANYRTQTRNFGLSYDATLSDSEDNDASQRQNLDIDYTRFLRDRWLAGAIMRFTSNDELGLDLRTSLGVGGGRILR